MPFDRDKQTVLSILRFTESVLSHLIEHLPDAEGRDLFLRAWKEETWHELQGVIKQIDAMSEDDRTHAALERAGLTAHSLKLKGHYLGKAARAGKRTLLLDLLNKFLGSLASGMPGAEPVKELKEWLEDAEKERPEPDRGIITIFNRGGFVP
jgi:hypothetical protein